MASITPMKLNNGMIMQMQSGDTIAASVCGHTMAQRYPQIGGVPVAYWCATSGIVYAMSAACPTPGAASGSVSPAVAQSSDLATWVSLPLPSMTTPGTGNALCLAEDGSGNLGMLYQSSANNADLWFAFYNGSTWAWQNITNNANSTYPVTGTAALNCDASGNFYAAWYQPNGSSSTYAQLCYATRTTGASGTWGAVVNPGSAPIRAATYSIYLFLDSNPYPRIFYYNNQASSSSKWACAYWNGSTWTVSNSASMLSLVAATIDSNGNLYYTLAGTSILCKFTQATNSWSTAAASAPAPMALAADTSGNVYLTSNTGPAGIKVWNGSSVVYASKIVQGQGATAGTWSWQKPLAHPLAVVIVGADVGAMQLV